MRTLTLRGTHIDRNDIASKLISKLLIYRCCKVFARININSYLELSEAGFGSLYDEIATDDFVNI